MNDVEKALFRPLEKHDAVVRLGYEGSMIAVPAGLNLAAALLAAGVKQFRKTATGSHRGPYCMMGVCFECMVEIQGEGFTQACQVKVREGMQIAHAPAKRLLDAWEDGGVNHDQ